MRIVSATLYALNIPFKSSFSHSLHTRDHSDSIIVKLETKNGITGYGEGAARPYVTGETVDTSIEHIRISLVPSILGVDVDDSPMSHEIWSRLISLFPENKGASVIAWNASRCAVELALLDCWLKENQCSLSKLLPPQRKTVVYSGVIESDSIEKTKVLAKQAKKLNLGAIKIKVSKRTGLAHVKGVRDIVGPAVSIRLDANGDFDVDTSIEFAASLNGLDVECLEQPIPRGNIPGLVRVKKNSPIPIMVDESLVTLDDAKKLIEAKACDFFNLRLSKNGGVFDTIRLAETAIQAGIQLQLGCQVGETAILSAAGRHVAAFLKDVRFVEGSYGEYLLTEDISHEDIRFGSEGKAPILGRDGLGVAVREEVLEKHSVQIIRI
jgi:L-alanine-DL-glutamate epimerase-like enolase superfamily enzyme